MVSYIEFFSVEQPDKLRGARRSVLYVNEANNVPFEAYTQLSIRTSVEIYGLTLIQLLIFGHIKKL